MLPARSSSLPHSCSSLVFLVLHFTCITASCLANFCSRPAGSCVWQTPIKPQFKCQTETNRQRHAQRAGQKLWVSGKSCGNIRCNPIISNAAITECQWWNVQKRQILFQRQRLDCRIWMRSTSFPVKKNFKSHCTFQSVYVRSFKWNLFKSALIYKGPKKKQKSWNPNS